MNFKVNYWLIFLLYFIIFTCSLPLITAYYFITLLSLFYYYYYFALLFYLKKNFILLLFFFPWLCIFPISFVILLIKFTLENNFLFHSITHSFHSSFIQLKVKTYFPVSQILFVFTSFHSIVSFAWLNTLLINISFPLDGHPRTPEKILSDWHLVWLSSSAFEAHDFEIGLRAKLEDEGTLKRSVNF